MKTSRVTSLQRSRQPSLQSHPSLSRSQSVTIHHETSNETSDGIQQTSSVEAVGRLRWKVKKILESDVVERFVLLLIVSNCVALGFESNRPGFEETTTGKVLKILEIVFLTLFTIEMVMKMIALGCIARTDSYFRDGWNCLDFVVIVLGWVAFAPSVGNYSSLRAIRVLRSLRTITGIPGMRKLVATLLRSLPMLLDVVLLCAFAYFVFGIVGVQVFSGALVYRCGCPVEHLSVASPFEIDPLAEVCRKGSISDGIGWSLMDDQIYAVNEKGDFVQAYRCSSKSTVECPEGLICAETGNPHYGMMNFDNILWSWLTIFQVISMEGWTDVMYAMQDAVSDGSWIYFFILIIFGSFFAVNLALAVLYLQFTNTDAQTECSGSSRSSIMEISSSSVASLDIPVTTQHWFQAWCYEFQKSAFMETLTMILIVVNVVVMAANHYGMPQWQKSMEEVVNMVVAIYFLLEMIVKIAGLGWSGYVQDRMNLFDGVIVVAGMIEFIISTIGNGSGIGGSLYVLRVFRLLRIFKLSRSWKELNKIVTTVQGSIASMANLCLIFFLFIIVMALLGMQLFGFKLHFCLVPGAQPLCPPGRLDCPDHPDCYTPCRSDQRQQWISIFDSPYNGLGYCEEFESGENWAQVGQSHVPRHNFDNFFWAFLSAFQILTGENWNEVMYDLMRSTSYLASLYCILIIVVGNYILLNLFLAILLDNFAGLGNQEYSSEIETPLIEAQEVVPEAGNLSSSFSSGFGETESSVRDVQIQCSNAPSTASHESSLSSDIVLSGYSLFIFSPTNPIRKLFSYVVCHKAFEQVVVLVIVCSSIMLALESPDLDKDSFLGRLIRISDGLFALLFGAEALFKIVVVGFLFNGPGSYLRDKWNILDFSILLVGVVVQFSMSVEQLKTLRVLRTLRCLKPLRLASRNKGLKVVIDSLFQSVPPLLNVALVCLLFFLTFAILGINLLKGEFFFCSDDAGQKLDPYIIGQSIDKAWCQEGYHEINTSVYHETINVSVLPYVLHHKWKNSVLHFDNIGSALLAMFEMSTLEMWLEVMYNGIDAVGVDQQPKRDHNQLIAIFYIAFVIIGAFFVLNLFVSVTIDKFHEIKQKQEGRMYLLTKEQEEWVIIQRYLWVARPMRHYVPPKNSWRRLVFDGVNSTTFEVLIMTVIFVNVIAMSCTHYDMDHHILDAIDITNLTCTLFFVAEVVIKLIGLGRKNYFRDAWNVFDFVVTVLSLAGSPFLTSTEMPLVSVFRVFRVVRLLRLIPKASGLRTLFQTLLFSFPALFNVGGILSLFFFIYAVVGVQLFGQVKRGVFLNRHANFEHFSRALLTLFRMSTGESWNGIMHDTIVHTNCMQLTRTYTINATTFPSGTYFSGGDAELEFVADGDVEDRCNRHELISVLYFSSFILIVAFILLNVVIAVILDNFQTSSRKEHLAIKMQHIEEFSKAWSEVDPDATWYIPTQKLPMLLLELREPLGTKGTDDGMSEILSVILSLDIPDRNSRVHFLETLHSLMGHAAGTELPLEEDLRIHEQMFHLLPKTTDDSEYSAAHYHSGKYVQASIRGFLIRERMAEEIKRKNLLGVQKLRSQYKLDRA